MEMVDKHKSNMGYLYISSHKYNMDPFLHVRVSIVSGDISFSHDILYG